MAYTKKYFFIRVKEINELYENLSSQGLSNEYIYNKYVRDTFHISRSTFYQYLCIDYQKYLEE
jgi:hypothetical protein